MHSLASLISARFSLVVYWPCVCISIRTFSIYLCVLCLCPGRPPGLGLKNSCLDIQTRALTHTTHTHTHTHLTYSSMQWATLIRIRVPREQRCAWGMFCTLGPGTDGPYSTANTLSLSLTHTHTHNTHKGSVKGQTACLRRALPLSVSAVFFLSLSLFSVEWEQRQPSLWRGWSDRGGGIVVWPVLWCVCVACDETETPWLLWGRGHISVTHSDMLS